MKKVILFLCILLIFSSCKGYEVAEIEKTTESIMAEEEEISEVHNAEQAKQRLLSGEYNHMH